MAYGVEKDVPVGANAKDGREGPCGSLLHPRGVQQNELIGNLVHSAMGEDGALTGSGAVGATEPALHKRGQQSTLSHPTEAKNTNLTPSHHWRGRSKFRECWRFLPSGHIRILCGVQRRFTKRGLLAGALTTRQTNFNEILLGVRHSDGAGRAEYVTTLTTVIFSANPEETTTTPCSFAFCDRALVCPFSGINQHYENVTLLGE